MKFNNKLAVIIPTKDRKQELRRLLSSLKSQPCTPNKVIIVDGSDVSDRQLLEECAFITYMHRKSGLSEARNIGISLLNDDVNLVCFLDDDVVMEENSLFQMMSFWEDADESVGGCSFFITEDKKYNRPYSGLIKKIFCMGSNEYGRVLRSGVNVNPYNPKEVTIYTDWLSGGVTVWRRKVFNEYMFDEWFSGYGAYEDVDFSYRVRKKYKLCVNARAKVRHLTDTNTKRKMFSIGKKEVINRLYFVKKNPELSVFLSLWASFGEVIYNFFKGFLASNSGLVSKSKGIAIGIYEYLMNRDEVFRKK